MSTATDAFTQVIAAAVKDAISEGVIPLRKRLLTAEEAAEYLGLTLDALKHKSQNGQIPVTRIDRTYRYDVRALDRWIEQNTQRERA